MGATRPVAYFCAGGGLTAFGFLVNASADEVYKQRWAIIPFTDLTVPLGGLHRLFWIPIQYWGLAIAVGALAGL